MFGALWQAAKQRMFITGQVVHGTQIGDDYGVADFFRALHAREQEDIRAAEDATMKRVSYIYPPLFHYRLQFHERLREILSDNSIEYTVLYCDPDEKGRLKRDTVDVLWGVKVPITSLFGGILYQHGLRQALKQDLVIIQQENKLTLNYILNFLSILGIKKVAFFGHGRNFQSRSPNGFAERFKRFWATKVDWWFAYTDETRRHLESLGFSPGRITVFNNAVDTSEVRSIADQVSSARLAERRVELGITGERVGVFVGGLYPDKRLAYLVEAADRIRARVPDFELLVVGGGEHLPLISQLAADRAWIKVVGPRFGADKIELMMLGKLLMMPGAVGLAVLDAGAAHLPTVTTAFPYHGPEIAYITHGSNGLIVQEWEKPDAYADAVSDLLEDPVRLARMRAAAVRTAESLTVEAMATCFAEGVLSALEV